MLCRRVLFDYLVRVYCTNIIFAWIISVSPTSFNYEYAHFYEELVCGCFFRSGDRSLTYCDRLVVFDNDARQKRSTYFPRSRITPGRPDHTASWVDDKPLSEPVRSVKAFVTRFFYQNSKKNSKVNSCRERQLQWARYSIK